MIIIFCALFTSAQFTRVTDEHWCNNRPIEYAFSVVRSADRALKQQSVLPAIILPSGRIEIKPFNHTSSLHSLLEASCSSQGETKLDGTTLVFSGAECELLADDTLLFTIFDSPATV